MIAKVLTGTSFVAATLFLGACQTTGGSFVSEEEQSCLDAGFKEGTEIYDECVDYVANLLRDFEREIERTYRDFNPHIDCEVYFEDERFVAFCEIEP